MALRWNCKLWFASFRKQIQTQQKRITRLMTVSVETIYVKIPTKKEPIRKLGFTSRPSDHIITTSYWSGARVALAKYRPHRFWQYGQNSVRSAHCNLRDQWPIYPQYGPEQAWLIRDLLHDRTSSTEISLSRSQAQFWLPGDWEQT